MISKIFFKIFIFTFWSFPLLASDNGWIAIGGESFFDARNPWFLAGEKITYCLRLDPQTFSNEEEAVHEAFLNAFSYWQREFKNSLGDNQANVDYGKFQLGKNSLSHDGTPFTCEGNEDLQLLFGQGSLDPEQLRFFQERPNKYVAASIRTEYNRKVLRGKGFIFFSSDKGPHQIRRSPDTISQPWKYIELVKWTLIHELGHVFGVPHTGSSFMAEVFMDLLLSKYYYNDFIKAPFESFLKTPRDIQKCDFLSPEMIRFFQVDIFTSCFHLIWRDAKSFDVFVDRPNGPPELVAKAVGLSAGFDTLKSRPITFLRLTTEQTILDPQQTHYRSLIPGPTQERAYLRGNIISLNRKKSFPIHVDFSPESLTVTTTFEGKMITIFSFESSVTSILGKVIF